MLFSQRYGLFIFLFVISSLTGFAQQCYEIKHTNSGAETTLYNAALESDACGIKAILQSIGASDFHIVGYDYYPLLAYVDPYDHYDQVHENAMSELEQEFSSFIVIAKDHEKNSTLNYRVELKLPTQGQLGALTTFEKEAIKTEILNTIKDEKTDDGFIFSNNAEVERKGLAVFKSILESIQDGTFNLANSMSKAGYTSYPVKSNENYVRGSAGTYFNSGVNSNDYVYDYTGLEVLIGSNSSGDLFRNLVSSTNSASASSFLFTTFTRSYIITDSDNTNTELDQAEQSFLNDGNHFVMWIHHRRGAENSTESDSLYIKSRNNLTETEAEIILNIYFEMLMIEWMPDLPDDIPVSASQGDGASRNSDCSLQAQWGKNCLLPLVEDLPENSAIAITNKFKYGIAVGMLDGFIATLKLAYDLYNVPNDIVDSTVSYFNGLWRHYQEHESIKAVFKKVEGDIDLGIEYIKDLIDVYNQIVEKISETNIYSAFIGILNGIGNAFVEWVEGELLQLTPNAGYQIGVLAFDVVLTAISGGGSLATKGAKFTTGSSKYLKGLITSPKTTTKSMLDNATSKVDNIPELRAKMARCKILGTGCFVNDTPVLMARKSNQFSLRNSTKVMAAAASMPIVAVPIQEVQLLDYAVAHETVNSTYGLTANTDDDIYLDLMNKDSYTSDQQRERDQYQLDDENWNEVVFEEVYGSSTAKLALHNDWINQRAYQVDAVVEMNLPEQGISGPFRITSIKHILPQKKPKRNKLVSDFVFQPITAIFTHISDEVWNLNFDNGDTLGVTYNHPIFSITVGSWKFAGELLIGEKVLTYNGEAKLLGLEKNEGEETVYNLEIKELHNFLVGMSGIVVHNSYFPDKKRWAKLLGTTENKFHTEIKPAMIKDWKNDFPGGFGSNPDVGLDKNTGNLIFKSRVNGTEFDTGFPASAYAE